MSPKHLETGLIFLSGVFVPFLHHRHVSKQLARPRDALAPPGAPVRNRKTPRHRRRRAGGSSLAIQNCAYCACSRIWYSHRNRALALRCLLGRIEVLFGVFRFTENEIIACEVHVGVQLPRRISSSRAIAAPS